MSAPACHYKMTEPCNNCPFRREGGIRLYQARVTEIIETNGQFPCHKTTGVAGGPKPKKRQHCAGFLIFMGNIGRSNQAMQLAQRFKLYDPEQLKAAGGAGVFDTLEELMAVSDPRHFGPRAGDVFQLGTDVRRFGGSGKPGVVFYTRPPGHQSRRHRFRYMSRESWDRWAKKAKLIERGPDED